MFKKILLALVVIVIALVVVIATRPDNLHIERSANIAAAPQFVQPLVNDFHRWAEWSPWEKLDPTMKKEIEGGPGVGSKYHWAGNDKVGEGRMEIITSQPDKVALNLEFIKPWTAQSTVNFTFKPEGAGTKVTWASDGKQSFGAKAFGLFKNMDQMIGKDYEEGLANMNAPAAADAKKAADAEAAKKAADEAAAKKAADEAAAKAAAAAAPPPPPAKGKKKK